MFRLCSKREVPCSGFAVDFAVICSNLREYILHCWRVCGGSKQMSLPLLLFARNSHNIRGTFCGYYAGTLTFYCLGHALGRLRPTNTLSQESDKHLRQLRL